MAKETAKTAEYFKALGHPLRLEIVNAVRSGEVCVQGIVDKVGTSQSNVSQHLGILKNKGVLGCRKEENKVFYFVNNINTLEQVRSAQKMFEEAE